MSFNTLKKDELLRTAVEDFGVDVSPEDSKTDIITKLVEDGVTWAQYKQAHPDVPEPEPVVPANVVTSEDVVGVVEDGNVVAPGPVVRTRTEEIDVRSRDLFLIKMERENPYFEFKGHKFTQEHPFAVMPAEVADLILQNEVGFKIASPSEAAEYYG